MKRTLEHNEQLPAQGYDGGPLVGATAYYEDGTEIQLSHDYLQSLMACGDQVDDLAMLVRKQADKLFLTSWPNGRLRPVKVLGPHKSMVGGIYIRYLDGKGGTDTTRKDFLFDLPTPPNTEE